MRSRAQRLLFMNQKPTVSIGLPVYNGENYLAQALASVLGQRYTDFELIICDNASTDATQSICEQFAKQDARVRYIRQPENGGLIWNFNQAFTHARGKYFKWSAHDDLIGANFLADCVEQMEADDRLAICCTSVEVIDAQGLRLIAPPLPQSRRQDPLGITRLTDPPGKLRGLEETQANRRYRAVLLNSTRCYEEFGLIRTQVLREIEPRGYYAGSEKVFLAAISLRGGIKVLPQIGMYMRIHDERLSAKSNLKDRHELYLAPTSCKRRKRMPPQLRCAWGYGSLIWKHPMNWRERTGCVITFTRFLLQLSKWRAILNISLFGKEPPITAETLERGARVDVSSDTCTNFDQATTHRAATKGMDHPLLPTAQTPNRLTTKTQ